MKTNKRRARWAALAAALAMAGAVPVAMAADDEPMALRGIMDELGQHMQDVAGAIAREDWPAVTELAPQIAQHEQPPATEKVRILAWVGTDALKFRGHDKAVGEAAGQMGEAAKAEDGEAVIAAFGDVQRNCLACHQAYRAGFVEHFYGKD